MKTRTIIVTFEIKDNDLAEYRLEQTQKALGCKDFRKLPDTKELYENNQEFRELVKKEREARKIKEEFINKHNH